MLVLSRKKDEKIVIGDKITIMVIEIRGDKVRLGIDAPRDITVHREEVYEAIKREQNEQNKQNKQNKQNEQSEQSEQSNVSSDAQ